MMIARAGRKRNVMKMTDAGHAMQVGIAIRSHGSNCLRIEL